MNELVPPRWSHNNPIDLAGGETRDTIPAVLELVAAHPDVHAVVFLGLGIQSNQAKLMRTGGLYPDFGLDRIVEFHERQDSRYAEVADEVSRSSGKPVLTATESPWPILTTRTATVAPEAALLRLGDRAVTALGSYRRRTASAGSS